MHATHPDEPGQWRHGRGAAKAPIVHAELKRRLQQQPESASFKKLVVLMEVQGAMLKEMLAMMKESRDHKPAKVSKPSIYDCLLLCIQQSRTSIFVNNCPFGVNSVNTCT